MQLRLRQWITRHLLPALTRNGKAELRSVVAKQVDRSPVGLMSTDSLVRHLMHRQDELARRETFVEVHAGRGCGRAERDEVRSEASSLFPDGREGVVVLRVVLDAHSACDHPGSRPEVDVVTHSPDSAAVARAMAQQGEADFERELRDLTLSAVKSTLRRRGLPLVVEDVHVSQRALDGKNAGRYCLEAVALLEPQAERALAYLADDFR